MSEVLGFRSKPYFELQQIVVALNILLHKTADRNQNLQKGGYGSLRYQPLTLMIEASWDVKAGVAAKDSGSQPQTLAGNKRACAEALR